MSGVTCDQIRSAALDPGTAPADWTRRPDAAAHIRQCSACQDWLEAFTTGGHAWASIPADDFTAAVLARTSELEAVLRDLPLLAEMDPGQGFTERVLGATSRKPEPEGWRARAALAWRALVRRPRFAWEAAYVATVCWVLLFGNPVGAIAWSASNIGAVARERLGPPVEELRGDLEMWRARLAPEPPPARAAAAGPPAEAAPPVVRAWEAAASWMHGMAASAVDALAFAWERVAAWFDRLVDQPSDPSTEPLGDSARSRQ